MKSYISSSSTNLWRVIKNGFAPHDPLNLIGREEVDEQLNATAKHLLQQAVLDTHAAHIKNLSTAKEVWDYLTMLFIGNESIQSSKFDELKTEERDFIMRDNETLDEIYQRILALAKVLTGFGCKDNGDDYIKRMFITSINPREPIRSKIIRSRPDFGRMTSNEVLCEFTSLTILKKNAEETRARVLAGQGVHNLALKAKVVYKQEEVQEEICEGEYWSPEDAKYALNEHLALITNAFWDANKHKFKGSKFKSSPRKGDDSKVRHCYNCGGIKHFIAECPYENKEDHGGRLMPRRRSAKFSSSKKHGNKDDKKKGERLLVAQEEYDSGSEDDDDSEDEVSG
jgi:hypothetical protein